MKETTVISRDLLCDLFSVECIRDELGIVLGHLKKIGEKFEPLQKQTEFLQRQHSMIRAKLIQNCNIELLIGNIESAIGILIDCAQSIFYEKKRFAEKLTKGEEEVSDYLDLLQITQDLCMAVRGKVQTAYDAISVYINGSNSTFYMP